MSANGQGRYRSRTDLGEEYGHRVLRVLGKGGKTVFLAPARRRPCPRPLSRELDEVWPASGAGEDDESLGRSGHRDIAVDRSFDARAERLRVDEDDQVELEPLRQLRG